MITSDIKKYEVSLIVPVYNVAKYLHDCFESIDNQTFNDFEVILVDDGSTDESGKMCDEYAKNKNNVRIIHQKNQGLSAARNTGIKNSFAENVIFMDSDDILSKEYICTLVEIKKYSGADIGICNFTKFVDGEVFAKDNELNKSLENKFYNIEIYEKEKAIEEVLYKNKFGQSTVSKIFSHKIFDDIMFPENRLYEDYCIMYKVFDKANIISYFPCSIYYYRQRVGSISYEVFNDKHMEIIDYYHELLTFIGEKYPKIYNAAEQSIIIIMRSIIPRLLDGSETSKKKFNRFKDEILKHYNSIMTNNKIRIQSKIRCFVICRGYTISRIFFKLLFILKK